MHLDISEELPWALMGRVYDPTKRTPSLRSPLSPVTFIFLCHMRGWQSFFLLKGAFNHCTTIFLSRSQHYCENILSHKENVLLSCSRWRRLSSDCTLVTGAGCCLSLWSPEAVCWSFCDKTTFSVIQQDGGALTLLHGSCRCIKYPITLINNQHACVSDTFLILNWTVSVCIVAGFKIYFDFFQRHPTQICAHQITWIHKNLLWWYSCHSNQLKATRTSQHVLTYRVQGQMDPIKTRKGT